HRAARSLREGECDLAVAAGVNALLTPTTTLGFLQAGMLSGDGRCKTFDAHADGYVRGEGVGAVLLKRFKDAVRDGDAMLGVILGSAVNHGGRTSTLTAPNPTAQSEVVLAACRDAGIAPASISYIEAHGTGTVVGDPIEFNGLVKAFAAAGGSVQAGACGLGSLKSNIGHLEAAAGIAGVIKVLLALQRGKLPATLHVREVNPYLRLEGSPFRLITETEDWVGRNGISPAAPPRRAGVSSFGFGGANAHVVIGETPSIPPVEPGGTQPRPWSLATLSARDEQALLVKMRELAEWLRREGARYAFADICYTLNAGRHHLLRRRAFVVRTREELLRALEQVLAGQEPPVALAGERIRMKPEDEALFRVVWESVSSALVGATSAPDNYREKLWSLAGLYLKGYPLDWNVVHAGETRRRVPLPTYPFQRESYWVPGPGEAPRVTRSTKVSLPMAEQGAPESGNGSAGADGLVSVLASEAAALLKVAPEEIRADVNLSEYGFDSINFRSLAKALNDRLGLDLSPDVFFAHPTLTELAGHLAGRLPHPAGGSSREASQEMLGATGTGAAETPVSAPRVHREPIPIAVVGMGGVFPGSPSVEAFWENLIGGRDLVGEVPASRWDWRATYGDPRRSADKTNSKWGGFIEDADCFDAEFFGIS
ncbi:MAG: hypothetical protein KGS61_21235, partial [Verrucomicrobia bacterium]|nr:hypothetical protein [Verrucomicrobiota bacterium]